MPHGSSDDTRASFEHILVGDIYDAALNPQVWPTIMKKVAEQCDAHIANIVITDRLNPNYQIIHGHGTTTEQQQLYQARTASRANYDAAKKILEHGAEIGVATACHKLFPNREAFRHAMGIDYIDYLEQMNVEYQMGSIIELTDFRYSIISICRDKNTQPFSDDLIEFIGRLTPHIRRALQIHRQLSFVRHENTHLYKMFDAMMTGILLLDRDGQARYVNTAAEKMLNDHNSLSVDVNFELKTNQHDRWLRLQSFIDGAINTSSLREKKIHQPQQLPLHGGVIGIQDPNSKKTLMLTITPISELSDYSDLANDGITAAIFISDPLSKRTLARQLLKKTYFLHERECDICETFVNCMSIDITADVLNLSKETVRGYFKDIYAKTGHHSQAELMRFLMGLTINFEHIQ